MSKQLREKTKEKSSIGELNILRRLSRRKKRRRIARLASCLLRWEILIKLLKISCVQTCEKQKNKYCWPQDLHQDNCFLKPQNSTLIYAAAKQGISLLVLMLPWSSNVSGALSSVVFVSLVYGDQFNPLKDRNQAWNWW